MELNYFYSKAHRRRIGVAFDVDAQAYFDAAGITDATEKNAANVLVLQLKTDNIWDSFNALYLISPTSLAAAAVNAKNPGTFDITWVNTPTHSVNGVAFNGTNQYGRTGIVPNVNTLDNDVHLSFYSRTDVVESKHNLSCRTGTDLLQLAIKWSASKMYFNAYAAIQHAFNPGTSLGHFVGSRRAANDTEIYKAGASLQQQATGGGVRPAHELYLNANNNEGVVETFATRQCALASVGDSFTDSEVSDFSTAVQIYQTNVIAGGRQV